MLKFGKLAASGLLAASMAVAPAQAQTEVPYRTYVSNAGTDGGTCAVTSPCATLGYAFYVVATGGEVVVLNSGSYGRVTVNRSVSIRSESGQIPVTAAISVNAASTDFVAIEGLAFNPHINSYSAYPQVISVYQGGDVLISNCRIAQPSAYGIVIAPNYSGTRVTVSQTTIGKAFNAGILVAGTNGQAGHLKLFDSLLVGNVNSGVEISGAGNDAVISGTRILGSAKGISLSNGGVARSYGDNVITSGDAMTAVAKN